MNKKITLTQNLTYMALMAAINVIFSLLAMFFPLSAFFLMIALPLTSVIVTLYCQNRYFIIYAIATILLSLIVTMQNMEMTIFYVIPSLASGFLFGMLIKYKWNAAYILLSASLLQVAISYLTIPIISAIYGPDMIVVFLTLLKLENNAEIAQIVLPTIFAFSFVQSIFSYMIIQGEIHKFNYDVNTSYDPKFPLWSILLWLVSVLLSPWLLGTSILLWAMGLYFSLLHIFHNFQLHKKKTFIFLGIGLCMTLILYPFLYQSDFRSYAFYAVGIVFYLLTIDGLLGLYLPKGANSHTIEK